MQGTLKKQVCGYKWIRIGYADTKFSTTLLTGSLFVIILLAFWVYKELPDTKWRLVNFLSIYFVAAILYTNIGVWLHEQLHCLAFLGTTLENRTLISFSRKHFLFLNGYYKVRGTS